MVMRCIVFLDDKSLLFYIKYCLSAKYSLPQRHPMRALPKLPPGLLTLTRVVRVLTAIGAIVLCCVPPWFWLTPEWVKAQGSAISGIGAHPMVIDDRALALGALSTLPAIAVALYGMWQLWELFGEYAQGRVFGSVAHGHLRRFAWAILVSALLTPFERAAIGIALTLGNPVGQRLLMLSITWNDYLTVLCGAVLLAVATVMSEAVRLAEENDGFV